VRELLAQANKDVSDIKTITIRTHEACLRIIDKRGPLRNPADRDHCIQYMVAVALIFGRLTAGDYEDEVARDVRIDALRAKMECIEDVQFTSDYHDPERRSIPNGLSVEFTDGRRLQEVLIEYPVGHRSRRAESIPLLEAKFEKNLGLRFTAKRVQQILDVSRNQFLLEEMSVNDYVDLFLI
jgi:2-methylcitrate dehydratase